MLRHDQIWRAIDALAATHGLTPSGLARRAGLDPTTFNRSKRLTRDGRARWPSTESIAKILAATGTGLDVFTTLLSGEKPALHQEPRQPRQRHVPLIGLAQAGTAGYFDDAGYPAGGGWDEIPFPEVGDTNAYALEISGDSMEPVYRDGDIVIVSPAAPVRRGDRVVVKTAAGEVMAKDLLRQSARRIELRSLNPAHELRVLDLAELSWVARIVWASQ
ncbi:MAG: helix-turn-helix transcriptional regulator [Alphaproteobacteria bacterium]|nr:helix-turn-helix transcriptional regulator [Alphaproteobacteria bacterium]